MADRAAAGGRDAAAGRPPGGSSSGLVPLAGEWRTPHQVSARPSVTDYSPPWRPLVNDPSEWDER